MEVNEYNWKGVYGSKSIGNEEEYWKQYKVG